ncbi:helix-turn-helix domain-containing protein [Roseomonas sp. 573]|uniref:Helix-turn-helix domain-containing protein n=2 Tax=Roseomonas haemaphysalidis TaxID=2768162 RepID=A0ABS3KWK5_9PROT|nr:helix-turn-helix transcriptional regulator [Roseomonas haemaphysalidis]MBO1081849.1 helix-turn-helix domain-containing protein [Roseomonas haemaphysalidis]
MTVENEIAGCAGSSLDDFLAEEGILEEVVGLATKRVIAWELEQIRKKRRMSKEVLASRMHTSRTQVDRLLDPENPRVQLDTVARAARVLGLNMQVKFETA